VVVAEVILMVVVILVAIPVGSFVFGLFGGYARPVEVTVDSAVRTGGNQTTTFCTFALVNLGSSSTGLNQSSFLLRYRGQATPGSFAKPCEGQGGDEVIAGSNRAVSCTFETAPRASGDRFAGWVSMSDGETVSFAGTFSQVQSRDACAAAVPSLTGAR